MGFRQCQPIYTLQHAQVEGREPLPRIVDQVLSHGQVMPAPLPRVTKDLCPSLGGHPLGVPGLPPPIRHLRLPSSL